MDELLVACLCADWCGTCREYAAPFAALARAGRARCTWIDIEEHEEVLGDLDVDDFPTLLIARGDAVLFFGTVTPHAATLQRLVDRALAGDLKAQDDPRLAGLPARARAVEPVGG